MDRIDEAFTDLRLQEAPNISQTADKYGIHRSRLSRHWNGVSKKKDLAYENQRLLTTAQSKALIQYRLTMQKTSLYERQGLAQRNFGFRRVSACPRQGLEKGSRWRMEVAGEWKSLENGSRWRMGVAGEMVGAREW
jgi:hypothetical protein